MVSWGSDKPKQTSQLSGELQRMSPGELTNKCVPPDFMGMLRC